MSNFNLLSNISILSNIDDEEASLKSYNFNNYSHFSSNIIENNYEFNYCNNSNQNIYDINDIFQNILTKNENQSEFYKNDLRKIFHEEKDNDNKNQTYNPLGNPNIIIEIKNTNFTYEDKISDENIILNIFSRGEYDIYSNNIINEALNDPNKICKKIKKRKKIFIEIPKTIKKKKKI